MANSYVAPTMLGILLSTLLWLWLGVRNYSSRFYWFAAGCMVIGLGSAVAVAQYYIIFFVHPTPQDSDAMHMLFFRLFFTNSGLIIFHYKFKMMQYTKDKQ